MLLTDRFLLGILLFLIIQNTLAVSFKKSSARHSKYNEKYYHKNPPAFQQVRGQIITTKSTTTTSSSIEIEVDTMQCPVGCVCQYARFNDLPLSRWINYMQKNFYSTTNDDNQHHNNNNKNSSTNATEQGHEEKDDAGNLSSNNPYIKQATCILQRGNDVPTLINMLPHDLQALILIYTGMEQNETLYMSLLKPLNQLNTLEISGSQKRNLHLVFDEPLPFLLHAKFEFVTLIGSENDLRHEQIYNMLAIKNQFEGVQFPQDEENLIPYEECIDEKKEPVPHFVGWSKLQVLRIHSCELREIHFDMFSGLESLQHLSLEHNNIEIVPPYSLSYLPNLKTLSLAHNLIRDIIAINLAGLLKLVTLDLSFNRLHKLNESTFPPFPNLHYVDFRQNDIRYIFPATFWIMNATQYMYFDSNEVPLELWNNAPFDELGNLKILEIGNISVNVLQQNMFKGLSTLESLHLRGRIQSIEFDAFASLPHIRELNLSNCQINEISMDAFMGCKHLELLDLSYNNISFLPLGLFDEQLMLEEIYLQHNQLRTLPTTFLSQPKLNLARLHDNPWQCSCDMSNWLPRITNQLRSQRTEQCITLFSTGQKLSCKRHISNKQDRSFAPRCDNYYGRSVFYVIRKNLKCYVLRKRDNSYGQGIPHWLKTQSVSIKNETEGTREQMMRHARVRVNSLNHVLHEHNALDEYNIHGLDKKNNNNKSSRQYYINKEDISNDI